MYELIQVGPSTYYIDCPAKMGLYRISETDVCLIDSGNDKDAGKKALRHIEDNGWKLDLIINTHSHADHIGGNQLLQQRTGCRIAAPGIDCSFTSDPVLEPVVLYGAFPPKELRGKALMAKGSQCSRAEDFDLPKGLEIIPLPGHSYDQIGVRTPDDVVFLADALIGENILSKYKFSYVYNAAEYLETLRKICGMTAKIFVPAHAEPAEDIRPLAEFNIKVTEEIAEDILDFCSEPRCLDDIMAELFARYDIPFTISQYYLNGCTVKAILSMLCDEEKMKINADPETYRISWELYSIN